tara:strand:+ start:53 stop:334 length:282 start_codon:yes stop_codon:yes gene_type:complete
MFVIRKGKVISFKVYGLPEIPLNVDVNAEAKHPNAKKRNAQERRNRKNLSKKYCIHLIIDKSGIKRESISNDMINAFRESVRLSRLIKQIKNG